MFCTKCKCEYREGFKICADCGIELIEKLPDNKTDEIYDDVYYEYKELVTIGITNNRMVIALVKSILDAAGIRYFIKGELSRIINSAEIQVSEEDVVYAKELLKELDIQN